MSVYRREGIWQSELLIDGKRYRKSLGITTTKKDARTLEAAWKTEILMGEAGLAPRKGPTVAIYGSEFLQYCVGQVKPRSYKMYIQSWKHVEDFKPLAAARLDEVDAPLVEKFANHLVGQQLKVATVNGILRTFRRALFIAFKLKHLNREPRGIVSLRRGERVREYVVSETDEKRLLEWVAPRGRMRRVGAGDEMMRSVITFAIDSGLRADELVRLKWDDVESTDAPIAIHVREGKTKQARRRVPLTRRAARVLETVKEAAREGVPHVFTRYEGRHPLTNEYVSARFREMRVALNIPEECCFHSLRHTAATRMGAAGASPFVLCKLFGWSDIKIAARYCHPDAQQLERAVAALGR